MPSWSLRDMTPWIFDTTWGRRTNGAYRNMSMVSHYSKPPVVTWRDAQGYHNAMIDWQFQKQMKNGKPNYPVPAKWTNGLVAVGPYGGKEVLDALIRSYKETHKL